MSKVRIVGSGLLGAAAALEAHRLGARDITLHARNDASSPLRADGLELRPDCTLFGDPADPLRRLLEWHGATFESFELDCGSLNPTLRGEPTAVDGYAGPVIEGAAEASPVTSTPITLRDALRVHPTEVEGPLSRYCQWRLQAWLDQVHASAAEVLGVSELRSPADALANGCGLAGLGRTVSLPRGGFCNLRSAMRKALENIGVDIPQGPLPSARATMERNHREILVWVDDPAPLLAAQGMRRAATGADRALSHVFKVRLTRTAPFVVQDFTAAGVVFRVSVYESRGETLACVECVGPAPEGVVRCQAQKLLSAFTDEPARIGQRLATLTPSRSGVMTLEAWRALQAMERRVGGGFVSGAWEHPSIGARFTEIGAGLAAAMQSASPLSASAA